MKQNTMIKLIPIAIPLLFLAGLPAWANTDSAQTGENVSTADQNEGVGESGETTEATGLDLPVDGSSLEAFNKSLEIIKETATESQYKTLENAIEYLLVYDFAVKQDRTKLAAKLDGMTGWQIIDKIKWRKIQK
jgi:hypothetical protein